MSRESITEKAIRYLITGRVTIIAGTPNSVVAAVRGQADKVYTVTYDPTGGWWSCTCPARDRCAHLLAVRRITAPDIEPPPAATEGDLQ